MATLHKKFQSLKLTEDKDQQGQDEGKLGAAQQQGGGGDNGEVKVALLNFRSVNNKLPDIKRIITENKLDILLITETWLKKEKEGPLIEEAESLKFTVHHKMRKDRQGGGVAILASKDLDSQKVQLTPTTTFEHVAAEVKHKQWDKPVLIINVYQTANGNLDKFKEFLNEFQELLNHDDEVKRYNKIMVTGDFNIWVDDESKTKTKKFKSLLANNSLVQHVNEPTHQGRQKKALTHSEGIIMIGAKSQIWLKNESKTDDCNSLLEGLYDLSPHVNEPTPKKGHTLDLVISRNVTVSDLIVNNDGISDHYTIYFKIRA